MQNSSQAPPRGIQHPPHNVAPPLFGPAPQDIAWVQKVTAERMADKVRRRGASWRRPRNGVWLAWAGRGAHGMARLAPAQPLTPTTCAPKARTSPDPWCRLYARLALAGLPRGGGNGDDIRMGILHAMRENGIREGHRPVGCPRAFGFAARGGS